MALAVNQIGAFCQNLVKRREGEVLIVVIRGRQFIYFI